MTSLAFAALGVDEYVTG